MLEGKLFAAPLGIAGCLRDVAQGRIAGLKLTVWYVKDLIASLTPFFDVESKSFSLYNDRESWLKKLIRFLVADG